MRLAIVTDVMMPFRRGGIERRIYELGRRLARRGHEVHVITMRWWEGPPAIELEGMALHGVCPPFSLYAGRRRSIVQALLMPSVMWLAERGVEVIVVDNGSKDDTGEMVPRLSQGRVRLIREDRPGYGNALRAGFDASSGQVLVMCDADGQYPVRDVDLLVAPIVRGEADLVLGSRRLGEIEPGAMPWLHRYIGNPLLTWLQNRLFGTRLTDAHTGFRALSRQAYERLRLQAEGMEFAAEMLVKAAAYGLRVREVPISYRRRLAGRSKLRSFRNGWRHLTYLLSRFPRWSPRSPLKAPAMFQADGSFL